jgi:hypothetical protein
MAISDADKARAVRHLGYPDTDTGYRAEAGFAVAYELLGIVQSALEKVNTTAEARIVAILDEMDGIDTQMQQARSSRAKVLKLGDITLNDKELDRLQDEYARLGWRLAEIIGCQPNPYSMRYQDHSQIGVVL